MAKYQTTRDELSRDLFDVLDDIASYRWDLEKLMGLHMGLSKAMKNELNALDDIQYGVPALAMAAQKS